MRSFQRFGTQSNMLRSLERFASQNNLSVSFHRLGGARRGYSNTSYTVNLEPVTPPESYSRSLRLLHWGMAAGIIGCVATVKMAQWTPKENKERKGRLMWIHKSLALVVLALVPLRLAARRFSHIPAALPGPRFLQLAGKLSHAALYVFLVGLPLSGFAMGWFGGYGMPFFLVKFRGAETPNKDISGAAYQAHALMGKSIVYLLPLHIGGAAMHAFKGQPIWSRVSLLH